MLCSLPLTATKPCFLLLLRTISFTLTLIPLLTIVYGPLRRHCFIHLYNHLNIPLLIHLHNHLTIQLLIHLHHHLTIPLCHSPSQSPYYTTAHSPTQSPYYTTAHSPSPSPYYTTAHSPSPPLHPTVSPSPSPSTYCSLYSVQYTTTRKNLHISTFYVILFCHQYINYLGLCATYIKYILCYFTLYSLLSILIT